MQKKSYQPHKDGEFALLVADGSATLSGRDCEFQEPTLRQEHTLKRANLSGESLKAIGKRFNLKNLQRTRKLGKTSVLFKEIFIYHRLFELGVQLFVPQEESFPFPLKYIDVIRSTHTDSGVAQEKRMMTVGLSTEGEICPNRGQISRESNDTPPKGKMWSWGD